MSGTGKIGKRKRRLYWTLIILSIATLIALLAGIFEPSGAPVQYRPGEKVAGITDNLRMDLPKEAPKLMFMDVTKAAGLNFNHFSGPRSSQLPEDMGSGAAWGDYDNDGDLDLFLVSSGGSLELPQSQWASCVLYNNRGNGTFQRDFDFPDTRIIGMAAAWADYDNDGWQDLVVTGYNSLLLFHNQQGTLTRDNHFESPKGFWAGAAWADYDNDGDMDLYICGYVRYIEAKGERKNATRQYGKEVPYTLNPASYEPERNLLFRNKGKGIFIEVATELGVDNRQGRSLSALWRDFNQDGFLDLYIANDISDNALYLGTGAAKFKDFSHAAWVADYRGAMGLAAGDWNGDMDDDLFVSHWIAQENALYDSLFKDPNVRADSGTKGGTKGNRQKNKGDQKRGQAKKISPLRFMDQADMVGLGQVALRVVGWGTAFADLDEDGWLDLLVANGSTFEAGHPPVLRKQPFFLFWNRQGKTFHNLVPTIPALAGKHVGRGLAVADYDNDGHLDFLVVNHGEGVRLYRSVSPTEHNRVMLTLRGKTGNGEGARITVHAGGLTLMRSVGGGGSYLSQNSRRLLLGLGVAHVIDKLEIHWLDGTIDKYANLQVNCNWEIIKGRADKLKQISFSGRPVKATPAKKMDERQRITLFWKHQRAAVQAMRVELDWAKAIHLFKKALALDPFHEDSLYYLGQALIHENHREEAMETFKKLTEVNPTSHRGFRQLGFLYGRDVTDKKNPALARQALERALAINSEETGVMLLLGETDLLEGRLKEAEKRLNWVCQSNPQSKTAFYLRAYIAWRSGDNEKMTDLIKSAILEKTQKKQAEGSTAEGDTRIKMYRDETILSDYFIFPKSKGDRPDKFFANLSSHLKKFPGRKK